MSKTYDDTVFCAETGLPIGSNVIRFPTKQEEKPVDPMLRAHMALRLPPHIGPSFFEDVAQAELAKLDARFAGNEDGIPEPGPDF